MMMKIKCVLACLAACAGLLATGAGTDALRPAARPRLAVVPAFPLGRDFDWHGQTIRREAWTTQLAQRLVQRLDATRRFTVFDQTRLAEAELLLACEVKLADAVPQAAEPFADVTYRVKLAATGAVKWTDRVQLEANSFAADTPLDFLRFTTDAAASTIVDGVLANLVPYEITGRTEKGMLLVGEGGAPLRAGEFLTVFALGEEVKDPRTGKVVDRLENAVGTVQIVRVDGTVREAQVVDGDPSRMAKGSRLRRVALR